MTTPKLHADIKERLEWNADVVGDVEDWSAFSETEKGIIQKAMRDALSHIEALEAENARLREALGEIFFGAWCFDDKPHRLYHRIITAAREHADPKDLAEILRVMYLAVYKHDARFPESVKDEIARAALTESDPCVSCGIPTPFTKHTHIDDRIDYVEGAGQLCRTCYEETYG